MLPGWLRRSAAIVSALAVTGFGAFSAPREKLDLYIVRGIVFDVPYHILLLVLAYGPPTMRGRTIASFIAAIHL